MIRVHTPEPTTGSTSFLGVDFSDGVATVESLHPVRELALRQHGYTVEHELDVDADDDAEPIFDLHEATIPKLRDYAERNGIVIPASARLKDDIVAVIVAAPLPPVNDPLATQIVDGDAAED